MTLPGRNPSSFTFFRKCGCDKARCLRTGPAWLSIADVIATKVCRFRLSPREIVGVCSFPSGADPGKSDPSVDRNRRRRKYTAAPSRSGEDVQTRLPFQT